jgi:hypothetical protein
VRSDLAAAVERGDVDELVGTVNGLCLDGDWDGVEELARRCRAAIERGRQLWPAAAHADYRLALGAPGPWAGRSVAPGRGRFAPGPLAEVAASTHSWAELAPHLTDPPLAAVVAQERVVRGEDLSAERAVPRPMVEVTLALQAWEPDYPVATYQPEGGDFPRAEVTVGARGSDGAPPGRPGPALPEDDTVRALLDLVGAWTAESGGRATAVVVEGAAEVAAAAVGAGDIGPVQPADALALMAWCGASGGAHGRRRGMAPGRFGAWWAVAAAAGLLDEWPADPDRMGEAVTRLGFWGFEPLGRPTGWRLGLVIANPDLNRSWAISARDPA